MVEGLSHHRGHRLDGRMLYMPRLFVYHCDAEPGSKQSETHGDGASAPAAIIAPAMIATWILGLWLAYEADFVKTDGCATMP